MQSEEYDLAWNALIKKDLEKIHKFLNENISREFADETLRNIFASIEPLRLTPERFPREQQLLHRKEVFRYVKYRKYKVLFCVERQTVHILHVFPARQNPSKIRRKF